MIQDFSSAQLAPAPSLAVHGANRLLFGPRPGDVERIESMGYESFVEEQLSPDLIDDSAADQWLEALPHDTLSEDWSQLYDRRNMSPYSEVTRPIYEVRHATWSRMVNSKRQLYERMVNFWYDHFNIYGYNYLIRSLFPKWDHTIREHALGNFHDFLVDTAKNPCMLNYLDNYKSTDGGPNENYAREMIELHTMGAMNYNTPNGYVDDDVYEASRCLTGWSYDRDKESPERGQFKYNHNDHDRFQKYFLGMSIPRDQAFLQDGLDVLERLADHSGTARHIAWKLCVRFISDNPPASIVESTAEVFYDEKNSPDQIRTTLSHLLNSQEFKDARMTKFKRPLDWMLSFMRALGIPYFIHESYRFDYLYDPMGQPMFSWKPPDGAPDIMTYWASSNNLIKRWRLALKTSDENYSKYGFDFTALDVMPDTLQTPKDIAHWWATYVMNREISLTTENALIDFLADGRNPTLPLSSEQIGSKIKHLAALCVTTPEFMRR